MPESGSGLAISFAAVSDPSNGDGVLVVLLEEEAIVAAAKAEPGLWRFELFHIAVARGDVAINTVENIKGRLAVNSTEIGACFRRPENCDLPENRFFTHRPNSRRISA